MRLPEIGDVFVNRYRIENVLGQGAFGRVYRAHDSVMQRWVALKVLSPRGEEYSTLTAARFVREAKLLAGLQDPHTLTLYDFGESPAGLLYMATEFIEGNDLKQVLVRERRLPEDVVIHIMRQLLSALREAHAHGLLHRDIKPANIIVFPYEADRYRIKLIDFGLAKSVDVDATRLTGEGRITGTPRYMSPEQVLGLELGGASDLYSLGLVAHEMLVGEPAIDGADMKELLFEQVKGPPIEVPAPFGSPRLRQVIAKMTTRNLSERASDAQSLLVQLDTIRRTSVPSREGALAGPVPAPAPRRRSWALISVSILAATVLAITVAALWPAPPPPRETTPSVREVLRPAIATESREVAVAPPDLATAEPVRKNGCGLPLDLATDGLGLSQVHYDGREMSVVVPDQYAPEVPHPLVVMLHDARSTATTVLRNTGIATVANEHRFIVVAPRDRAALTWRGESSLDEVHAAVAYIQRHACVDASRIYIWGNGFGSAMAHTVACDRDDIAAMAATYYRTDGIPECLDRPIPMINIAGAEDRYAPLEGGVQCLGRTVLSLSEQDQLWRDLNRCRDSSKSGQCTSWDCDASYRSCVLPGGRRFKGQPTRTIDLLNCDGPPTTVDVASLVWAFFEEHTL